MSIFLPICFHSTRQRRIAAAGLCVLSLTACSERHDLPSKTIDSVGAERDAGAVEDPEKPTFGSANSVPSIDFSATPQAQNNMAKYGLTELAVADLTPRSGSNVAGTVSFGPDAATQQMLIEVELVGLTPNAVHAVHVHAVGDCSADDARSAEGHFAPYGAEHGNPQTSEEYHVGDLGNVRADAEGLVMASFRSDLMAFTGPASVLQKAVIVHADADDFSGTAGDAGARIACGVVRT